MKEIVIDQQPGRLSAHLTALSPIRPPMNLGRSLLRQLWCVPTWRRAKSTKLSSGKCLRPGKAKTRRGKPL